MSVFTPLDAPDFIQLLQHYDLGDYLSHQGISAGTENSNFFMTTTQGRYVLTLFERNAFEELPFFFLLTSHLHQDGCRVPQPYRTQQGEWLLRIKQKPAVIMEAIRGNHQLPTPALAAQLAIAIANIHLSSGQFEQRRPNGYDLAWLKQSAATFKSQLQGEALHLLNAAMAQLDGLIYELPKGIIHADVFQDNVLFSDGQLSGVIDWYFASYDAYALDIAICLIDWCVDAQGRLVVERCVDFVHHYHQQRPLQPVEIEALPLLLIQTAVRYWLSRLIAQQNKQKLPIEQQKNVTTKDPQLMQSLTEQSLNLADELTRQLTDAGFITNQ